MTPPPCWVSEHKYNGCCFTPPHPQISGPPKTGNLQPKQVWHITKTPHEQCQDLIKWGGRDAGVSCCWNIFYHPKIIQGFECVYLHRKTPRKTMSKSTPYPKNVDFWKPVKTSCKWVVFPVNKLTGQVETSLVIPISSVVLSVCKVIPYLHISRRDIR